MLLSASDRVSFSFHFIPPRDKPLKIRLKGTTISQNPLIKKISAGEIYFPHKSVKHMTIVSLFPNSRSLFPYSHSLFPHSRSLSGNEKQKLRISRDQSENWDFPVINIKREPGKCTLRFSFPLTTSKVSLSLMFIHIIVIIMSSSSSSH